LEAILRPEQVRVVLFGPLPVLDALPDDDVRVSIDVFGLDEGTYSIAPKVDIPDRGVEIRSVQPGSVGVILTPTITTTLPITGTVTPESRAPTAVGGVVASATPLSGPAAQPAPLPVACYIADGSGGVNRYNGLCIRRQVAR
jgi:hypothetical protein